MASPAQLHLKQDGLRAWQVGSLEHVIVPFDAKDSGAQTTLMKALKRHDLPPAEELGLRTVQEGRNGDGPVYLDLREEAERLTLPYSL